MVSEGSYFKSEIQSEHIKFLPIANFTSNFISTFSFDFLMFFSDKSIKSSSTIF